MDNSVYCGADNNIQTSYVINENKLVSLLKSGQEENISLAAVVLNTMSTEDVIRIFENSCTDKREVVSKDLARIYITNKLIDTNCKERISWISKEWAIYSNLAWIYLLHISFKEIFPKNHTPYIKEYILNKTDNEA